MTLKNVSLTIGNLTLFAEWVEISEETPLLPVEPEPHWPEDSGLEPGEDLWTPEPEPEPEPKAWWGGPHDPGEFNQPPPKIKHPGPM
jgi:hypothetical protein